MRNKLKQLPLVFLFFFPLLAICSNEMPEAELAIPDKPLKETFEATQITDADLITTTPLIGGDSIFGKTRDYLLDDVAESVVSIGYKKTRYSKLTQVNGVAVSKTHVITIFSALKGVDSDIKLVVNGLPAEKLKDDEEMNWALLRVPTAEFIPAALANSPSLEERLVFVVSKSKDVAVDQQGVVSNAISKQRNVSPGYIDLSIAPELLPINGAVVFNNCGDLMGIVDKSVSKTLTSAIGVDLLSDALSGMTRIVDSDCPSESDKSRIMADRLEKERQKNEIDRKNAEGNVARLKQQLETEIAQKTGDVQAARKELETAQKEIEKFNAEALQLDNRIAEVEGELVKKERKIEETEAALKESEEADAFKTQIIYVLGGVLSLSLVLFFTAKRQTRKPAPVEGEAPKTKASFEYDVVMRGENIAIKIPADILCRDKGVVLGRSAVDCDFVLDVPSISRSHIKLSVVDGVLVLEDLGSANGSILNDLRLQVGNQHQLRHNDSLQLAETLLTVSFAELS